MLHAFYNAIDRKNLRLVCSISISFTTSTTNGLKEFPIPLSSTHVNIATSSQTTS